MINPVCNDDKNNLIHTEKSIALPDPIMYIADTTIQNLFKQNDTSDFPNLKLID